jgi:glycerophosphoryl diester phosphodiesterase
MATHPHQLWRTLFAATLTIAAVLVVVLHPEAVQAYSGSMIGTLRAPGQPAFIAGHRGDRADAPENTLPAFRAALAAGLTFVETDVQLTADGAAVIMHDETVDRTTNGTGAVADLTLAQIRALDAGSWFGKRFAGTRVPTLAEYLDLFVGSHQKALIELKGLWTENQVNSILPAIYLRGVQNRVVFSGFNLTTIYNLGLAAPAIPRVIIEHQIVGDPVVIAAAYGAIAIMTTPSALEAHHHAVAKMQKAGFGVLLYTLNSEKRWNEALGYGVDGIVTDEPSGLDDWIAATAPGT